MHRQFQNSTTAENLQDAMAVIMSYTGENTENEAVSNFLIL